MSGTMGLFSRYNWEDCKREKGFSLFTFSKVRSKKILKMTTHWKNPPQQSPRKYQDQHLSISQVNADIQKQKEDMQQDLRMLPGGVFKPTSASPSTLNR